MQKTRHAQPVRSRPRIYLDTSVISYYTSRLHPDPTIRARQLATKRWWRSFQDKADFYVSSYVFEEIAKGDSSAASLRQAFVKEFATTLPDLQSAHFGSFLFNELAIPDRSKVDAWHLAVAALSHQDYIVSWNFKHMANDGIRAVYAKLCERKGLPVPQILTPEQMPGWESV